MAGRKCGTIIDPTPEIRALLRSNLRDGKMPRMRRNLKRPNPDLGIALKFYDLGCVLIGNCRKISRRLLGEHVQMWLAALGVERSRPRLLEA
jgi:hypothetical protein